MSTYQLKRSDGITHLHPDAIQRLSPSFGEELLKTMPIIKITSGMTDYLDLVKPEELKGNTFGCGIGPFNRSFVTMKVKVEDKETGKILQDAVYTLFERYTGDHKFWVICISHNSDIVGNLEFGDMLNAQTAMSKESWVILKELINHNKPYESKANGVEVLVRLGF